MSEVLEREIAALPDMNLAQLQAKWRSRLKEELPPHIRKQLLVPLLAYKLQEQVWGGLRHATRRRIKELADGLNRASQSLKQLGVPIRIKPGTRLIRQWEGKSHQVTVSQSGFEYEGESYKSLSSIARLITGTRWSGPLFFGLKGRRS